MENRPDHVTLFPEYILRFQLVVPRLELLHLKLQLLDALVLPLGLFLARAHVGVSGEVVHEVCYLRVQVGGEYEQKFHRFLTLFAARTLVEISLHSS